MNFVIIPTTNTAIRVRSIDTIKLISDNQSPATYSIAITYTNGEVGFHEVGANETTAIIIFKNFINNCNA